ncbi:NAD-dependent epimerase/dehydratase family protein [Campylobacter helveticus]|uniref:NAD-dependent epimerase/dehydratase family protein n=1 Tax=Campylobacter helveticus TaxID=28898 RepID=UPI0029439EA9|nr:NAD-dependent epimerase/dehydratase family protein [Campylobacter helveticus]
MQKDSKIYVAGHKGTAGSSIVEELKTQGFKNIITKTHAQLNLINQKAVDEFFAKEKPEFVFFTAVLPCGAANVAQRADFIYENLMMQNNIIHNSYKYGVKKLICFGSGYMYPEFANNPLKEEYLLKGQLEYGAYSFGVAKIAGAVMCEAYNIQYGTNFLNLALNNLYGTRANFNLEKSRVLPALLRKFHLAKLLEENDEVGVLKDIFVRDGLTLNAMYEAKQHLAKFGVSEKSVEIWGSGKVRREFLHAKDLAKGSIFVMQKVDFKDLFEGEKPINTHINIGTGVDFSIKEVALKVKQIVGFKGELTFNTNKPDSTMDRLLDCSKMKNLGWEAKISLDEGIKMMYEGYLKSGDEI